MILRLKLLSFILRFTPSLAGMPYRGLAVEDTSYMDMIDDVTLLEWIGLEKEECAIECILNRCTYFFYNQYEWKCSLYEGRYFTNMTYSNGWRYYSMQVICPSGYEFIADTYTCLKLYTTTGIYSMYDEKRAKCTEDGGTLLKIDSYFKQTAVEEFVDAQSAVSCEDIAIQGKRVSSPDSFVYDDDTVLLYDNWIDPIQYGDPSNSHIALSVNNQLKWKGVPESMPDSCFVCEVSF